MGKMIEMIVQMTSNYSQFSLEPNKKARMKTSG